MRKIMKIMTIVTLTSLTSMQVIACKDDSKYNSFISDVSNSENNSSAFFGFLGTANDATSLNLQTAFDTFNNNQNENISWKKWIKKHQKELENSHLDNIFLNYYQGPSSYDKPSDPISSFWNDKNIDWQKKIFNWVYSRANNIDNPGYHSPRPGVDGTVSEITAKKDDDDNDMFTALPIVFIVSKGKLITAGQNWITDANPNKQFEAVTSFISANLLNKETNKL